MITRVPGALARAMFVAILVATPSLLLSGQATDSRQIVALVALFAAALTFVEYSATYPGLVEFRYAPPFNRIRFLSLFITVFILSVISHGRTDPTPMTMFFQAVGDLIGRAIDFPYSPVHLVTLMLPANTTAAHVAEVRTAAGIAYLVSLLTLSIFVIILKATRWPLGNGAFNVWVNLPTFDPTVGHDVVGRLDRDARINIVLGFLLPFFVPAVVKMASGTLGEITLQSPQTLVWTVAIWAFLPASLFMRGIAMGRVADMIREKRRQAEAATEDHTLQPA